MSVFIVKMAKLRLSLLLTDVNFLVPIHGTRNFFIMSLAFLISSFYLIISDILVFFLSVYGSLF